MTSLEIHSDSSWHCKLQRGVPKVMHPEFLITQVRTDRWYILREKWPAFVGNRKTHGFCVLLFVHTSLSESGGEHLSSKSVKLGKGHLLHRCLPEMLCDIKWLSTNMPECHSNSKFINLITMHTFRTTNSACMLRKASFSVN